MDAPQISELELVLRLTLAAALGAIIGLEREWRDRTAGLRTHMLVSLGSAAFTIVSAYGFSEWYDSLPPGVDRSTIVSDPTRIAAQIVTGIGFLGAGAIFRSDDGVRGLTTAASLWMMAAIGMSAGAGSYELAVATTVLMLIVLTALRQVSRRINRMNRGERLPLEVEVAGPGAIGHVFTQVAAVNGTVSNFAVTATRRGEAGRRLTFDVTLPDDGHITEIVGRLAMLDDVASVKAPDVPSIDPDGGPD